MPAMDAGTGCPVSTLAVRHAVACTDERVFPWRRQRVGECLLPHDRKAGVHVEYEAPETHLEVQDDRVVHIDYSVQGETRRIAPKSVVVAAGSFRRTPIGWPVLGGQRPRIF